MKRTLGKSGIEVSALGMGCWAIGGPWDWKYKDELSPAGWGVTDDAESLRALKAGIDAGITFIDTAANYGAGHSEKLVGKAITGIRDRVVVATKFGHVVDEQTKTVYRDIDQVLGNLRQDCENSLRRLNTDYIDIYQLHDSNYPQEMAPAVMEVLEELVQEGKILWYGWSTDLVDYAQVFAAGEHCTSIQFALNLAVDNPEMRRLCADHHLAGINKSPFSRGILAGRFDKDHSFASNDIRSRSFSLSEGLGAERLKVMEEARQVLTANGHTLPQACLAYIWALDDNMVPIPGFRTVSQVTENARAMELGPLSQEQVEKLSQIVSQVVEQVSSGSSF